MTRIVRSDDIHGLVSAADRLRRGALVIAPTDSGYGLFCDPFNDVAADKLRAARPRSAGGSLSLLVSAPPEWQRWACAPHHPGLQALLDEVWPGPLGVVAPARPVLPSWLVSGTGAVTVVHHASRTLNLLSLYSGLPLAAASASVHGRDGVRTAGLQAVRAELESAVDLIVEAPEGAVGDPPPTVSTVVSVVGPRARLLRAGAVGVDVLSRRLGVLDGDGVTFESGR
ncbi:L-threonylcarbamoyladenylate synthase [Streptomyces sp. PR69]|uniref:L-threonylcarbamoyladenylate synthase n=1 Tax=Streptomyces sp. PR69 TaxID=2984950 RepID=UPI0022649D5B|nr:L-threonylcarbamoyladenylate synthase [Streptomyces sp. PR69]